MIEEKDVMRRFLLIAALLTGTSLTAGCGTLVGAGVGAAGGAGVAAATGGDVEEGAAVGGVVGGVVGTVAD